MKSYCLLLFTVLLCAPTAFLQTQSRATNYLFAYFKNNGEDGLHLAHSRDGLKWRALNEDKPYLTPTVGSQKLMRDPCILQGPDGTFHLVWTTGWRGRDIGIAHSKDLIHWSEQRAIPVMEHEPAALNCWAPEIFYDETQKQYLIFWATTIPGRFAVTDASGGNGLNHRIYFVTTKDFVSYSKAALFYDDGFNVIDATLVKDGQRFVLILKDETAQPVQKNLRLAFSEKASGPFSHATPPFTINWVEGPTAIKLNGEWQIYFDMYRDKHYGAVKSRDWKQWEVVTDKLAFPGGARHGTVFTVSDEVLARLQLTWRNALNQPPAWYGGAEAMRIADNVLLYQLESGGWPKNINMAAVLSAQQQAEIVKAKDNNESTIDNDATTTQMIFLARVFNATKQATNQERYQSAFIRGLDYLLKAQYPNGGWPQFYPRLTSYYKHITYNDNAMINVMKLLREIARQQPAYAFVDEARRQRAAQAIEQGIECILRTQIHVNDKLTAWCAQHDEVTLAPAPARAYEKISLSGAESVGIVRFLMEIEQPTPAIAAAVRAAVAWFEQAKLTGIKQVERPDPALPRGYDKVVVNEPSAPPLWARFYEIGSNRPIFCGRDGVIKYSLAEIEHERRTGYNWYTDAPAALLAKDFPAWQKKHAGR